jgi:hypothetical protein
MVSTAARQAMGLPDTAEAVEIDAASIREALACGGPRHLRRAGAAQ